MEGRSRWAGGGEKRGDGGDRSDADRSSSRRDRGANEVLGLILLIGVVVAGATVVAIVAIPVVDSTQSSSETERAERAMTQFAHEAETVTAVGDASADVSLGSFDRGRVETRSDAGSVRISHVSGSTEVLYDESLGAVVYQDGDGELAYQNGAVWKHDDGGTTVVSPPDVEYGEGEFSFPIVRVTGDVGETAAVDATITSSERPIDVEPARATAVGQAYEPGAIRIEIESPYCDGWERSLEAQFDQKPAESCDDGATDRLVFELQIPIGIDGLDEAIVANEIDVHENAPEIEGDVRAGSVNESKVNGTVHDDGYAYPAIDSVIESKLAACDGRSDDLDSTVDEPGLYCVDRLNESHEFDTSNGDIEVVVRDGIGDPNYQDDVTVSGSNDLHLYADGDATLRGDAQFGNPSDPSQTTLLLSDESVLSTAKGGPDIDAIVYGPESTVELRGNPTVSGAMVADRVEIDNIRPGEVAHDDDLASRDVVYGGEQVLAHVDVTVYTVEVDDRE